MTAKSNDKPRPKSDHAFRNAVLRGLGVVVPPLLTIVIFVWVAFTVNQYVLRPVTNGTRNAIVWILADVRDELPPDGKDAVRLPPGGNPADYYYKAADQKYVPYSVYEVVRRGSGTQALPETAKGMYHRYVELRYLSPYVVIPAFTALFILVLYLLGKFMAVRIGRFFVGTFERVVLRLPVVRNVYSSVKQVSDFLFSPRELEFTRVVAVQYPRLGIWSLGFVTSESMADISEAAKEPVLAVLIPTSPMPVTGYTISVRKSETLDLDLTVDQAFQFTISCGVVVPPHQLQAALEAKATAESAKIGQEDGGP